MSNLLSFSPPRTSDPRMFIKVGKRMQINFLKKQQQQKKEIIINYVKQLDAAECDSLTLSWVLSQI